MVETINPVVYGDPRNRWRVAFALHVAGATVAAAAFGAALGLLGTALSAPWGSTGVLAVGVVALAYLARELFEVPVPLLEARRQVPDWWRTFFSRNVTALLYGAGVGVGFLTYLGHGTLLVVSVAAVAIGRPAVGAVLVGMFGLTRGLVVAVGRNARDPSQLVGELATFAGRGLPRAAHVLALAGVALAAALSVLSTRDVAGLDVAGAVTAGLALTFGWAAIAKIIGWSRWTNALSGYGLPSPVERAARIGVPLAEAVVVVLAVIGLARTAGVVATSLLAVFSLAVLRAKGRSGKRLPCGCFGRARMRDYRAMLARNALLAAAAVIVAVEGTDTLRAGVVSVPEGGELLPAGLAVAALAFAAWTLGRGLSALRSSGSERAE
jgi:hypothetical protein